jgi:hypothetical protein
MAVDEAARHQLYATLEATLGPESTSTLMSLLPPVGWADVATKQDLASLENALRADMADLRTELRTGLADLRTELHTQIGGLRSELHTEIGGLRSELHTEIGGLRTELHTTVRNAVFSMIGAMFTLAALTWAAVSIG